jgi:hypothetical protein
MRARLICIAALLLLAPLTAAGYAIADSGGRSDAAKAQSATARYHDLQHALDDGYVELPAVQDTSTVKATNGCASAKSGAGAMGVHFILNRLLDGTIDAQTPEVLVYEPTANGRMKLVALEYVATTPQSLFGQTFTKTDLAPYVGGAENTNFAWTLHAWIWKPNPSGLFMPWNPSVDCSNA